MSQITSVKVAGFHFVASRNVFCYRASAESTCWDAEKCQHGRYTSHMPIQDVSLWVVRNGFQVKVKMERGVSLGGTAGASRGRQQCDGKAG